MRVSLSVGVTVTLFTAWTIWPLARLIHRGGTLASRSRRYVRRVAGNRYRVLVVGDSSGVGVGASAPEHSVAGRLAVAHPDWTVGNLAVVGSRTSDVAHLLSRLCRRLARRSGDQSVYDVLIVHTGGNDALRATPTRRLEDAVDQLIACASLITHKTIIVTGGNLGLAPALAAPWSWWFGRQSRRVRAVFLRRTAHSRVAYVDLYRDGESDPTVGEPERFFAADGLHPTDDSYALWHRAIEPHVPPSDRLGSPGGAGAVLVSLGLSSTV